MAAWSYPPELAALAAFYEADAADPSRFDDEEVIRRVEGTFWSTNCWSFAEAAFAIIAPACARRPHLVRRLLRHPIEAMVAGGLDDPSEIVAQGVACATKAKPYVEPTEEGKVWLASGLPRFDDVARSIYEEILSEMG